MESANSHHQQQQLQDQILGSSSSSSSSSSATPFYYGVGTTTHAWSTTPTSFLNRMNGFMTSYPYPSEAIILNSREEGAHQENTATLLSSSSQYSTCSNNNINMAPAPAHIAGSFHNWAPNNNNNLQSVEDDEQLSRIKEEFSAHVYHRLYTDLLISSSNQQSISSTHHQDQDQDDNNNNNNNTANEQQQVYPWVAGNNGRAAAARFCSQQIFPSINVSSLNQMGLTANAGAGAGAGGGCLDMNLEALDLLTSSSFSGNNNNNNNQIGNIGSSSFSNYGAFHHHHMQQQSLHDPIPFYASNKISDPISNNGAVDQAKRSSGKMEPKAPPQNATKKSRLEARASCPPFKVRKEKLGDRIAALQQLVAPFGKTDTASVLMEAIGYIKFLQDQVETLSVPYMKASRNKSGRAIKGGPADRNNKDEELKRDLKSRGLCLVPLSCLSYITDGGAAAVWPPPPHFGGAT